MNNIKVNFYDTVEDEKLKFAVIVSCCGDKWVWCKHKERDTYEIPGGHREAGEAIDDTARRELYEETGAMDFDISPICVYSVNSNGEENFGMLFFAEIREFEPEINSEIERIEFFDSLPSALTYPQIQPHLFEKAKSGGFSLGEAGFCEAKDW